MHQKNMQAMKRVAESLNILIIITIALIMILIGAFISIFSNQIKAQQVWKLWLNLKPAANGRYLLT